MPQGGNPLLRDRPRRALPAAARLFAVSTACLLFAGCLETREVWMLSSDGSGTYALSVRWNAEVLHTVAGIVGGDVIRKMEGRSFPLRVEDWRDGLRGLEGVEVESLTEESSSGGFQEISLKARFRRVQDLLAWEVLARRSLRIAQPAEKTASLTMEPLSHVPVIDSLASLVALRDRDPDRRLPSDAVDALRVRPEDAILLSTMLAPHLDRIRFGFRVETPGPVRSVGEKPQEAGSSIAPFEFTFGDLVKGRDRAVRLTWRPLAFDRVPAVEHVGDAPAPVLDK